MAAFEIKPQQPGIEITDGLVTIGGPKGLKYRTQKNQSLKVVPKEGGLVSLETPERSDIFLNQVDADHKSRWRKFFKGALEVTGLALATTAILVAGHGIAVTTAGVGLASLIAQGGAAAYAAIAGLLGAETLAATAILGGYSGKKKQTRNP